MTDPLLTPRLSVTRAARYLGVSPRTVRREIAAGLIKAIDVGRPGAARPTWAIAVVDLRRRILEAEAQAARRLETSATTD